MYSQAQRVDKPSTRQSEFLTEFGMWKGSNSQFIFNSCTYSNITDCTELSRILNLGLDLEKLDSLACVITGNIDLNNSAHSLKAFFGHPKITLTVAWITEPAREWGPPGLIVNTSLPTYFPQMTLIPFASKAGPHMSPAP